MNTNLINEKVLDLLMNSGLNWTVEQKPLYSGEGTKTGSVGLFRSDTREWINTVTHRYTAVQNYELAQLIVEAGEQIGVSEYRGGHLSRASKVYIQAALPDEFIGKSAVKRWLTGLNIHGKGSAAVGSTNTTVVCQNTFHKAWAEVEFKFRHTKNIAERMAEFFNRFVIAVKQDEALMRNFKIMADIHLKDEIVADIFKRVTGLSLDTPVDAMTTRQKKTVTDFSNAVAKEVELEGPTLWGLFNSVTRWTNHVAKTKDRESYIRFGAGYELSNTTYEAIMAYIAANEANYDEVLVPVELS